MKLLKVLNAILIGIVLWIGIGLTLESFEVPPAFFMMAGYGIYPIYQFVLRAIFRD